VIRYLKCRDVNKAGSFKAKAKSLKAKARSFKAKTKAKVEFNSYGL